MIKSRLTGHNLEYQDEWRDFVYSDDINKLIDNIISQNLAGIIDCRSGELTRVSDLAKMVIRATPTAYGRLIKRRDKRFKLTIPSTGRKLSSVVQPTSFEQGLSETIYWHKSQTYHQMRDKRSLQDFIESDERVVKILKGSSAAHLCVVADANDALNVRKVAIYDGVEGNGIAKVANEIRYYLYIQKHMPELARMYPQLVDAKIDKTFSSETIEYLPGENFYQAMKNGGLPELEYKQSMERFINDLSSRVLTSCRPATNPENNLDAYYVERSLSRLDAIKRVVSIKDKVMINGKRYIAPHIILEDLLRNDKLRKLLAPRTETFCFHGDLTFLNTVFVNDTKEIKLIDPRGYIGDWDPLYDYAKMQFTLAGFGEMVVGDKPIVTANDDGYEIHFDRIPEICRQLHDEFPDMLANDATFQTQIIDREPNWRERIALAEATHFLADIPFRLYTDDTTDTALASYVIGTYYLNRMYEALKK
jgi:hypothetical protein